MQSMASRTRRRRRMDEEQQGPHRHSHIKPETPHFFKVILSESLAKGRLAIPSKFVRKYGNILSSPMILRVPDGKTWLVELENCDGTVFFCKKGWSDFADHYSLEYGHFLVFEYEEGTKSIFKVIIFDRTATEIEYPLRPGGEAAPESSGSEEDTAADVIVLSDEEDGSDLKPELRIVRRSKRLSSTGPSKDHLVAGKFEDSSSEAPEPASGFKSMRPFFQVRIRQSHLKYSLLTIPHEFMKTIGAVEGMLEVKLRISDKSWPLKLHYHIRPMERRGIFSSGWNKFAKEANLREGDVCVFQLMSRRGKHLLFDVSILGSGSS